MHRRPLDHEITQPRTLMIKERRVCMFSNLEKPSMGGYIVVSRAFSSVLGRLEFTRLEKKFAKLYYHLPGQAFCNSGQFKFFLARKLAPQPCRVVGKELRHTQANRPECRIRNIVESQISVQASLLGVSPPKCLTSWDQGYALSAESETNSLFSSVRVFLFRTWGCRGLAN
jgi:hypothetical protein